MTQAVSEWHVMLATRVNFEASSFDLGADQGAIDALRSVQVDRVSAFVARRVEGTV